MHPDLCSFPNSEAKWPTPSSSTDPTRRPDRTEAQGWSVSRTRVPNDRPPCQRTLHIETSLLSRGFSGFLLGSRRGVLATRGVGPYCWDGPGSGLSEEPALGV